MARPFLSFIVPVYNNADFLAQALIEIDRYATEHTYSYEILVVDDVSTDATKKIIEKFSGIIRHIKYIENSEHRGKGSVVKIGMLAAYGNWRYVIDITNTSSLVAFNACISHITSKKSYDIVSMPRYEKEHTSFLSSLFSGEMCSIEWIVNAFIARIFKSDIPSFLFSVHCFSSESAENIFSHTQLTHSGYISEALLLSERMGYTQKCIPALEQSYHHLHFHSESLQIAREMIKMRWWLYRGHYTSEFKNI